MLVLIYRKPENLRLELVFPSAGSLEKQYKETESKAAEEILRLQLQQLEQGYDIVFVVRKEAGGASYKELEKAVYNLLKRKLYRQGDLVQ